MAHQKDIYLMYTPNDVTPEVLAEDLRQMLEKYDRELVKFLSNVFPENNHRDSFLYLDVKIGWAKGGNYKPKTTGQGEGGYFSSQSPYRNL
jgi:hypothetical protein